VLAGIGYLRPRNSHIAPRVSAKDFKRLGTMPKIVEHEANSRGFVIHGVLLCSRTL
jgi:hypothetical protein